MEVKKVYCRKKKSQKTIIDHIPKCFQLPRTTPSSSKPRTQFYFPISSSFQELEPHSSKEIQSSVTVLCSDMSNDTIRDVIDPSSSTSIEPPYIRRKTLMNGMQSLVTDAKLFGQKPVVQPCSNRKDEDKDDALNLTPNRSQLTESSEVLHYKKHPRPCKESSGSSERVANHHDQLSERGNSSSSSRVGTGCTGRARSKRERKRKVHFDEVTCPLYTSRKVRRFKIMRSLGLAAPVGSPFISSQ